MSSHGFAGNVPPNPHQSVSHYMRQKAPINFSTELEDSHVLEIDETFQIDRGYPESPLEIERKIDK